MKKASNYRNTSCNFKAKLKDLKKYKMMSDYKPDNKLFNTTTESFISCKNQFTIL